MINELLSYEHEPYGGDFPRRDEQFRHHMMLQRAFITKAQAASAGIVRRLMTSRERLGNVMLECAANTSVPPDGHFLHQQSWRRFFELYYYQRERFKPTGNTEAERIRRWFLSGEQGFRFQCPVELQSTRNELMIVMNCMTRGTSHFSMRIRDRFTGQLVRVRDVGSLVHLAIRLRAPSSVIQVLVEDSCGLALNVRGKYDTECEVPPFGMIDNEIKARQFHVDGLQTMVYLGIKYMWCLPFFYKFSVWKLVKYLATYPNPTFRRTCDILMDFQLDFDPVIQHAIEWDRKQSSEASSESVRRAFDLASIDQGGSGKSFWMRLSECCIEMDEMTPLYWTLLKDPVSFMNCVRPQYMISSNREGAMVNDGSGSNDPAPQFVFHCNRVQSNNESTLFEDRNILDDLENDSDFGDDYRGRINDPFGYNTLRNQREDDSDDNEQIIRGDGCAEIGSGEEMIEIQSDNEGNGERNNERSEENNDSVVVIE